MLRDLSFHCSHLFICLGHWKSYSEALEDHFLHLCPQGVSQASYSFCGASFRSQIFLFFSEINAFYSLHYISVGNWGSLTPASSMFFPAVSVYVVWVVHYHTKHHFFVKNRHCLSMVKNESTKETCPLQAGSHGSGLHWVKSPSCLGLHWTRKARHKAAMWYCQVSAGAAVTPEPKTYRNKLSGLLFFFF